MCGIIGFFNIENALLKTKNGLEIIKHRGLDGCGIYNLKEIKYYKSPNKIPLETQTENCMGHTLHSIEGNVKQPIKQKKGVLIFNGEIYNYKTLNKYLKIDTQNDSQTLLNYLDSFSNIELKKIDELIENLDGDFSFAYYRNEKVYLVRDIIGVKPLWYYLDRKNGLEFSSEKKSINSNSKELNPREILIYNTKEKSLEVLKRKLKFEDELKTKDYNLIKKNVYTYLVESVKKRIPSNPNKKIGLLFSGGIDSTAIALILKSLNINFVCYTAKVEGGNIEEAQDLIYGKEIAKKYDLNLKTSVLNINELETEIINVMKIIEDCDYIKVSVALPFYLSCKLAREEGIEIMFSGLGSEEIFAGYRRHKQSKNPNKECYNGLLIMHERDLYRDDVITMNFTQELRVPFLDKELIEYSLKVPSKFKLDLKKIKEIEKEVLEKPYLNSLVRSKIVLRDSIKEYLNLETKFAERQKKAAQYGSKFDKGILKLAKLNGYNKQEYLDELWFKNISKILPKRIKY